MTVIRRREVHSSGRAVWVVPYGPDDVPVVRSRQFGPCGLVGALWADAITVLEGLQFGPCGLVGALWNPNPVHSSGRAVWLVPYGVEHGGVDVTGSSGRAVWLVPHGGVT